MNNTKATTENGLLPTFFTQNTNKNRNRKICHITAIFD